MPGTTTLRPIAWWRAVVGPWAYALCPRRAARTQLQAGRWAFLGACMVNVLALAGIAVALVLVSWLMHPVMDWNAPPGSAQEAPRFRTVGEVWATWHEETVSLPVMIVGVVVPSAGLLVVVLAWLNLPRVHRSGPILPSLTRSLRAVAAGLGFITLAGAALALVFDDIDSRYRPGGSLLLAALPGGIYPDLLVPPAVAATIASLLWWLGRAVATTREGEVEPELPAVCEGCGYDLTHVPDSGRCPECGLHTDLSLGGGKRQRSPWENHPALGSWLRSSWAVLWRPRRFYEHVRLRGPWADAAGFAALNYVLIGLLAAVWVFAMIASQERARPSSDFPLTERICIPAIYGFGAPVGCWLAHRALGALVTTWWLIRGRLLDYRWAAKVIAYESVFLWVFCAFWGMLATSFVLREDWLSRLLGTRFIYPLGMPPEAAVLLGGTLALAAVWLWRYEVAYRQIRWSNF